jgi:hypothetical protein
MHERRIEEEASPDFVERQREHGGSILRLEISPQAHRRSRLQRLADVSLSVNDPLTGLASLREGA